MKIFIYIIFSQVLISSVFGNIPDFHSGRLIKFTNPLGIAKTYSYDKMSRLRKTEVSGADQLTETTIFPTNHLPLNTISFSYDPLGKIVKKESVIHPRSGCKTSGANASKDSSGVECGSNSVFYSYDALGNLTKISNNHSANEFSYDALNRVISVKQSLNFQHYTLNYIYDAVGNRTKMITPWSEYNYTYNDLNQMTKITVVSKSSSLASDFLPLASISFSYDKSGRRISKSVSSPESQASNTAYYKYDKAGQILSIIEKSKKKILSELKYEYDRNGNIISKDFHASDSKTSRPSDSLSLSICYLFCAEILRTIPIAIRVMTIEEPP